MNPVYRISQASAAWRYAAYAITGLVLAPLLTLAASWALPLQYDHWQHLWNYILPEVLRNTVVLLSGVCGLSWVLGVSLAWFLSQFEFLGSAILRRAVILPFAMPAYVSAFIYVGLLDYTGPIRTFFRESIGSDIFVPEIRSISGAIVLLALALFPYVYVLSYDAFSTQGRSGWEAARSLGAGPWLIFRRLALSFARPWIAAGLCLVALEVLNDFGTVSIVGVNTFTSAIYKVWYGFFSPETAAQLASLLILIAFAIYFFEQRSRRRQEYTASSADPRPRTKLRYSQGMLVSFYCFAIFALSFLIPFTQLLLWAWRYREDFLEAEVLGALWNSFLIGSLAGSVTCFAAGVMILAKRYFPLRSLERAQELSFLGYGIPGSVLAIGVFLPLVRLDHLLIDVLEKFTSYQGGLLLTGSIFTMVLALSIRFLAVAGSSVNAGMERISPRFDEAARLFGVYGWEQFRLLQWPLLRRSFASGFILVFVDVIKEMPLTLMTRPFSWDTLSVRIFSLVSEGEWQRAAVPGSLLAVLGLLPLFLFSQKRS